MRTWDLLSELPIDVEGYVLDPHEIPFPDGSARRTTVVRLQGGGLDGVGEDITYDADAQLVLQDAGPEQPLAGSTTLAGFSRLLDGLDLSPGGGAPEAGASPDYRRWAFESAALDLALRQAGLSLAELSGGRYTPCASACRSRSAIRRPRRASTSCARAIPARTSSSTRPARGPVRWQMSWPRPERSTSST